MLINFLILYANIFSFSENIINKSKWELRKDENNIKVYLRKNDNNISEYLAVTEVNSDINSIFDFILDFDNSFRWMYKLEESEILGKKNDSLFHVYFKIEMNWPLKKRDLVSDVKIYKDDEEIVVSLNSSPKFIPLNKDFVRINDSKSEWILTKIDSNTTKVSLQSYAVIEKIPSFVIDMFILDGPLHSLSNLRKRF